MTETPPISGNIHHEPEIQRLLARMPNNVATSFTDEQLIHLKTAVGARNWGTHAIDLRGTFALPFYRWRYYYVILLGRNRRSLTAGEKRISLLTTAISLALFLCFCALIGLLVLYLLKSAMGIDLFPDYSLGIWSYFKDAFK